MTKDDEVTMMAAVTSAMEEVRLPSDAVAPMEAAATAAATAVKPSQQKCGGSIRPFDVARMVGPASDPIPFEPPAFQRGMRHCVVVYNQRTQQHAVAKDVLFRDYSREYGVDQALQQVECAYWKVAEKQSIPTIMGHVNICHVLKRCRREREEDDDDSSDSEEEMEEDIVFTMTEEYVAIKVNYCERMERLRNKHAEDPLKEIAAMQLIGNNHPNVLGCIEVLFDGTNLNVVMPYCGSGDLFQLLQDRLLTNSPGLPEPEARYMFRQVMSGLRYLHHVKGICHRDISPENIMMNDNGCLIIDLGMCIRVPYSAAATGTGVTDISGGVEKRLIKPQGACGKMPYMSPEIYRSRQDFDGEAVDVWTVGTILFCILTGNRSYERPHKTDPQFYWMTNGLSTLLQDWGIDASDEIINLIQGMLQIDPRLRLTIDEVENHPWFAHPDIAPPGG